MRVILAFGCPERMRTSSAPAYPVAPTTPTLTIFPPNPDKRDSIQYPLEGCSLQYPLEGYKCQNRAENYFSGTKQVSNWVMGALLGLLNTKGKTIEESPVSSSNLARLLKLIDQNVISGKIAKTVFEEMAETGKSPEEIIREKDLVQVTDISAIEEMITKLIESCPKEVADYKAGKTKVLGFFIGRIMKETKGKANPEIVNRILMEKLHQA